MRAGDGDVLGGFAHGIGAVQFLHFGVGVAPAQGSIVGGEIAKAEFESSLERIKSVHYQIWKNIEEWGLTNKKISKYQCDMANTISNRLRVNRQLTPIEIENAHKIIDLIAQEAPELFFSLDELNENEKKTGKDNPEISLEIIQEIVKWDKKNKILMDYEYRFMFDLSVGKKSLSGRNLSIAVLNLKKVKKHGFAR